MSALTGDTGNSFTTISYAPPYVFEVKVEGQVGCAVTVCACCSKITLFITFRFLQINVTLFLSKFRKLEQISDAEGIDIHNDNHRCLI